MGRKRPKPRATKQLETQVAPKEVLGNESSLNDGMIAAAVSSIQGVLMKVCRLCETKDGPFLNIFDADKVTAKKIEEVMPFGIAENDDLPHKICFRCSAKVEELFEFIHKCIKTQESLRTAMGKKGSLVTKTKTRALWEEKLNKTNLTNEDICDALIKKAMEGIKDIPLNPLPLEKEKPQLATGSKKGKTIPESQITCKKEKDAAGMSNKSNMTYQSEEETDDVSLNQIKLSINKSDDKVPSTRSSRSNKSETLTGKLKEPVRKHLPRKSNSKADPMLAVDDKDIKSTENQAPNNNVDNNKPDDKPKEVPEKKEESSPPINIMDHVSTIKVNGVGTLYLCKLCNRNFLKKDVVLTHGCAKNNVPKDSFSQNHVPPPEVPKPPTVKYIKMDKDFKKPVLIENKPVDKKPETMEANVNLPVQPVTKQKIKAGPASKVKTSTPLQEATKEPTPPTCTSNPKVTPGNQSVPSVQFPGLPSLNSRYKLVPGPNNTFTLVEDETHQNENKTVDETVPSTAPPTKNKKRKFNATPNNSVVRNLNEDVIDLEDNSPLQAPPLSEQPYPVGLFQTVPHHSGVFAPNTHPTPAPFTNSVTKKQSYTIVQTGNPSKLLISTKPQPVVEEPSKKKSKKSKTDPRETIKEPFGETLGENVASKDPGFFTFINVDPLVQPSYVLPTDNIIQESQISTSTPVSKSILDNKEKDKYSCNMCNENFSREKKLLTHIQSHYNQMDEEDQIRAEKNSSKRKTRKT